ncbi:MAG: PrpF domain-containing protein, partial [Alphaproteobacteria bacterium]
MTRYLDSEQIGIRCSIVRGGTSKGVFFLDHDVPPPGAARDALLKRVMGTPDVMQIDGLGGTHIVTSKIAIIG